MDIQNDSDILSRIGVASPCSVNWDTMSGDERARFCQQCNKHVYNLSEMSRKEAENLILKSEGKTCVRFYLRKDGTIMTEDCPVGIRIIKSGVRRISVVAAAVASFLLSFFPGLAGFAQGDRKPVEPPAPLKIAEEQAHLKMGEMVALPRVSAEQPWMAKYRKDMVAKILEKLPKDWKSDSPQVLVVLQPNGKVENIFTTKCSADQNIAAKLNQTVQSITYPALPKEANNQNVTFRLTIAKETDADKAMPERK